MAVDSEGMQAEAGEEVARGVQVGQERQQRRNLNRTEEMHFTLIHIYNTYNMVAIHHIFRSSIFC